MNGIGGGSPSLYADYERQTSQRFDVLAGSLLKATPAERETTLKDLTERNPALANRLRQFFDRAESQQQSFVKQLEKLQPAEQEKAVGWPQHGWNKWQEELRDVQDRMTEMAKQQQATMQTWMEKQQAAVSKLTEHQQDAIQKWTESQKAAVDKMAEQQKAAIEKWSEALKGIQAKIPVLPEQTSPIGLTGHPRQSIVFTPEEVPVMGTQPTAKGRVTAYAATSVLPEMSKTQSPLHIVSGLLGRKTLQMTSALDAYGLQASS
jgi:hypothetical protein